MSPVGLRQRQVELTAERSRIETELKRLTGLLYQNAGEVPVDMIELTTAPLFPIAAPGTPANAVVDGTKDLLGRKKVFDAYKAGDVKTILGEAADRGMDAGLDRARQVLKAKKLINLTDEEAPLLGIAYSAAKSTTEAAVGISEGAKLDAEHEVLIRRLGNVNRQISYIEQRLEPNSADPSPSGANWPLTV